uniref:Peptidase S8 pro-domain domain-containing protein n=1 Tax=Trichobilharzia regenti TaxID=157069 RepID=A0AA85JWR4_TRIRE|nr:unnamed protein product [Trichobilharzia regenti]
MNCESFLYILLIMSSCNIVMNKLHCRQDSCEAPVVEYVVRVDGTFSDAKAVARLHGLELIDKMIGFEGIYIMHLKQIGSKKRRRRSPRDISGPGVWVFTGLHF